VGETPPALAGSPYCQRITYWSHEGDVPGYNTIGAVSSDGRTTVVLSINSNVDDPVLAAEYRLVDHVMCDR
jgi:hypothetical protein